MGKLLDSLHEKQAASPTRTGRYARNFLAHKADIMAALREGWTIKQIWERMVEGGMTAMSYANLCRLVQKHVTPPTDAAGGASSSLNASPKPSPPPEKSPMNTPAKKPDKPERELSERERLDRLKEEAFASVRAPKPHGPLIAKPLSREAERRKLFGDKAESDTNPP